MTKPAPPSSPACSMHEADDAYMGYAGRAELIAFLEGLRDAVRPEPRWSEMLARQLEKLGATLADPREPIVFAERGPASVVQRLRAILPRVRDDRLHAELMGILREYERR